MTWLRGIGAAALIAALAGIWLHGRQVGVASCEARHAAAVAELEGAVRKAQQEQRRAEATRLQMERRRDEQIAQVDRAARAMGDGGVCLSADSVQRLDGIGRGD